MFIAAIGAFLLAAAAYAFILFEVRNSVDAIQEVRANIETEREKSQRRESVRAMFEKTEPERRELEGRLVDDATLVNFFEKLEGLAEEAGVALNIEGIVEDVQLEPNSDVLEWLQMEISAEGGWENVYRFLVFIELLPYETRLDNIRLKNERATRARALRDGNEERIAGPIEADAAEQWTLSLSVKVLKLKN